MITTKEEALTLLNYANVFIALDEDELETKQVINLNDAFYWASADAEKVEDDELLEVAQLFINYGWCGIYYWVCNKRGSLKVEFEDINRFIDFVKHEEELVVKEPNTDKRAYMKYEYTLGE